MTEKKTVAEWHAELQKDPEYQARTKAQEEARQKVWDEWVKAEIPLVTALRAVGVEVQAVWDLANRPPQSYPTAIPVLMEHIKHTEYPDRIRDGILRALSTPDARSYWDELIDIFEHNTANLSPEIRYVAALALSGAADDTVLDDVIRLVKDKRLGFDRAPLLLALIKSKTPQAKMMLLELRDDPDLGKEIKKMRRLERHQKAQ